MNDISLKSLFNALIPWYIKFMRNLPWRSNPTPYHVWLSEIVFQQTRIDQGIPYYLRLIQKFPDIFSIANAPEDELLKLWQGLGYYSRAINMQKTAKIIESKYAGSFPSDYQEIIALPGIGSYTAAAIASIAFGKPIAVFDGNVRRILSRLFCIDNPDAKICTQLLETIIANYNPAQFNQSMMELGALICKPKSPICSKCPVNHLCCAFINDKIDKFPTPKQKTTKEKLHFSYFQVFRQDMPNKFALIKRNYNSIWRGLYEFPSIVGTLKNVSNSFQKEFTGIHILNKPVLMKESKHELTHKSITAKFYSVNCVGSFHDDWEWHTIETAMQKGMHKLMFEFFK